jgi:hypothetical protein
LNREAHRRELKECRDQVLEDEIVYNRGFQLGREILRKTADLTSTSNTPQIEVTEVTEVIEVAEVIEVIEVI